MTQKNNFNMVTALEMMAYIEEQGLSYDDKLGGVFHDTESLSVTPFTEKAYTILDHNKEERFMIFEGNEVLDAIEKSSENLKIALFA